MYFLHTGWYLESLLSVQSTEVKKLPHSRECWSPEAVSAPGHHSAASQWRQGLHRSSLWREGLRGPSNVPKLQVTTEWKKKTLRTMHWAKWLQVQRCPAGSVKSGMLIAVCAIAHLFKRAVRLLKCSPERRLHKSPCGIINSRSLGKLYMLT